MINLKRHIVLGWIGGSLLLAAVASGGEESSIGRTTEKELNVVLSSSFGKIIIGRGESEKIVACQLFGTEERSVDFQSDYNIRNRVGYLDLSLGEERRDGDHKKGSLKLSDITDNQWQLKFSDALPIAFDIELGVAQGKFNLTGLQVKDFTMSCGASDVLVSFDAPNTATLNEMNIECGVGKFEGRNLGNANFKHFRFEGGVGAATLDFSGKIQSEVDVDVQVGMGVCTIILPRDVGTRIQYEESLVSRIDLARDIHTSGENQYISDNYKTASGRMNIRIDAGLGSVRVKRR